MEVGKWRQNEIKRQCWQYCVTANLESKKLSALVCLSLARPTAGGYGLKPVERSDVCRSKINTLAQQFCWSYIGLDQITLSLTVIASRKRRATKCSFSVQITLVIKSSLKLIFFNDVCILLYFQMIKLCKIILMIVIFTCVDTNVVWCGAACQYVSINTCCCLQLLSASETVCPHDICGPAHLALAGKASGGS